MIPFELKGVKFSLPERYSEVTTGQFIALSKVVDNHLPQVLSILSGLDVDQWNAARLSDAELALLTVALEWMKDPDMSAWPMPERINIAGKDIVVPKDISILPLGAKMYFELKVLPLCLTSADEHGDSYITGFKIDAVPCAISPYIQQAYNGGGKFEADILIELEQLILSMPITEAYPVAAFFLSRWASYEAGKLRSSMKQMKIKHKPELMVLTPSEI